MDTPNASDLAAEVKLMAQTTIIGVFARLMRIHIATQHGQQRKMTLAILESELDEALRSHESQVLVGDSLSDRGQLFKTSYSSLTSELLVEVGRGLTDDEKLKLGVA